MRGVYGWAGAPADRDPLGFFEREAIVADERPVELMVYPRVVPIRQLDLPLHHPSLDVVSPKSLVTDPTRTATVRDYRPDDSPRLIHWATTARRGAIQVRVLEPATSLHVSLMIDVRGFTFGIYRGELLELALSALASIAVYMQDAGFPVAWYANSQPRVSHLASMPTCKGARIDGRLEPIGGPTLMPWALAELPSGSTVVLAASEMPSGWRARSASSRARASRRCSCSRSAARQANAHDRARCI